ncbi:phosphoribosylamine--glycine ligase [Salimicrobium halophilum]|uniref:Phosphoribosylamine--glycine ligase n=1 Tax=Salimicrobium halophilum TaxID=86666 RepID=A0A1G8UE87_9BACI|nr:phosphoribosylamine--glycine ligase [Salimicrobium halophilum]SDJ52089.1 phosphoribosylamine--glycine ligase [Salimicrobium halophilum]
MNVLIIGSGGREHSLVQKLNQHHHDVHVAPGNDGMEEAVVVDIPETEFERLALYAKEQQIDWTIIGPENPLSGGIVDVFREKGLKVFGPDEAAARIEGSKRFAKRLMKEYEIPTADYEAFTDVEEAHAFIDEKGAPIVVKADGLAAGKGVVVAATVEEAKTAVSGMLEGNRFGSAGHEVVIEEFLDGKEFSLMAFVDGEHVYPMMPARDHKRAFDGDKGPNTGGMGAFAPVPDLAEEKVRFAVDEILFPVAKAMQEEGRPFQGILYAGLIETKRGVEVIEFNARFGDPETQVVLPLLKNDLIQVIEDLTNDRDPHLQWKDEACVGVVLASSGYPGSYEKGNLLPAHRATSGFFAYAGVKKVDGAFTGNGGRVLMAGATGASHEEARRTVYQELKPFAGSTDFFFRTDIAKDI